MSQSQAGLIFFLEEPGATVARWSEESLPPGTGAELLSAAQLDLLRNFEEAGDVRIYVAPCRPSDVAHARRVAEKSGVELLELPEVSGLQRWDSALSILYNRCRHRAVFCADGRVIDFYPEDLARARRKLDRYWMVLGREGEDGYWLIGMDGYREFLGRVNVLSLDPLHSLLEASAREQEELSLLDTKNAGRTEPDSRLLRYLTSKSQHRCLKEVVDRHGLAVAPATGS